MIETIERLIRWQGLDQGDPCQAKSYHGFNGTEDQLIEVAATFILAN